MLRHGRAFLSWWLAELADLLPPAVRARLTEGKTGAGIIIDGETLHLTDLRGGRIRALCSVELAGMTPSEAGSAIGRALTRADLNGRPVVLGLPEHLVLRYCEMVPAGAARRLGDVLRLKLESAAPLPQGSFYWGYRIAGPAGEDGLPVECVLAKAEAVDGLTARLADLGVDLAGVYPAEDLPGEASLNLMPAHLEGARISLWSPLNRALAGAACLLALLALLMTYQRQEAALETLRAESAALRDRAASVLALRAAAQQQLQTVQAVRQAKSEAPPLMGILDELSRLLPDGTWVNDFRLQKGEVQLIGQSQSASSLIGLIEGSPSFANARFGSPVVRDPQSGAERFNIQFDWSGVTTPRTQAAAVSEGSVQ